MCLDRITEVYRPSLFNLWIPKFAYKSGYGWKLFQEDVIRFPRPNLISVYKGNRWPLPIGKWLDEKEFRGPSITFIYIGGTKKYSLKYSFGWHILEEEPDSHNYHVNRRVKYKKGHTVGIDATYKAPTIVAKYMKILED